MINKVDKAEILGLLQERIGYNYSQSDMAKDVGVSPAFVTEVLAGRKAPTQKFFDYLGIEKVVTTTYVRKS